MDFSFTFIKIFFIGITMAAPLFMLFMFFIAVICLLGLIIARREQWSRHEGLYYAFITATTVGYGDFAPVKRLSRFYAIIIAFMGLIFTGILVSLSVNAASYAFKSTQDVELLKVELNKVIQVE